MRSSEKTDFEVKMWRAAIMYLPYILYRPNVPYYLPCEHCLSLFCTSRILFSLPDTTQRLTPVKAKRMAILRQNDRCGCNHINDQELTFE